jgi:hypothetical protein
MNPGNTGGQNGVAVGDGGKAKLEGVTAVYSGRNGVIASIVSAGTIQPGIGGNAFMRNDTRNFVQPAYNFNSGGQMSVFAEDSQWEHCYASNPPSNANICDGNIVGLDTSGGGTVNTADAKPHQANTATVGSTSITSVYPPKVSKDGLVHIFGTGFNAIDGHPANGNCVSTAADNNQCGTDPSNPATGLKGTCVEVLDNDGVKWIPAKVKGVTPTHVVIESPVTCLKPTSIRVRRLAPQQSGGQVISSAFNFCTGQ